MKYLVTVGHLGKDTGAVSPYDVGGMLPEQERYINAQQVTGAMAAAMLTGLDIAFASPGEFFKPLCNPDMIIQVPPVFSLSDRIQLANATGRVLIEFHNNSAGDARAHGTEIIAWSRESAGYTIGSHIMGRFVEAGIKSRGVKTCAELGRKLAILRRTRNPSLILEGGFLSSRSDMAGLDVDLDGYNTTYGALVIRGLVDFESKQGEKK